MAGSEPSRLGLFARFLRAVRAHGVVSGFCSSGDARLRAYPPLGLGVDCGQPTASGTHVYVVFGAELMQSFPVPYSLPQHLEPDLARVLAYWQGLKRGEANMPFWDDINISALPDLLGRLMLIDVFNKPVRFRFAIVGDEIKAQRGGELVGKFLDELEARDPLRYLNSQSSATVESHDPTYYRTLEAGRRGYSRLLLPMWGDGHIGMLLGAVTARPLGS
jgi:hypothetical protein